MALLPFSVIPEAKSNPDIRRGLTSAFVCTGVGAVLGYLRRDRWSAAGRPARSAASLCPKGLTTTARLFLDLVAAPVLLRALIDLKTLDAEIDAHVARSVLFFLALADKAA